MNLVTSDQRCSLAFRKCQIFNGRCLLECVYFEGDRLLMNIMLELTNRCTLRCPTCFSHQDQRAKSTMSFDQFKHIIDQNHSQLNTISLYNYGEPFLNPDLARMIRYAKEKGVPYIKVATNGMHLSEVKIREIMKSRLDYLSISLDGATREIYEKFRIRGQFDRVVTSTRKLVKVRDALRSNLTIEVQFIIMSHNEHEIRAIEDLARDLNVDILRLKTVLIKKDQWKYLLPASAQHSRYSGTANCHRCFKPTKEVTINCDGSVIPCCYVVEEDVKRFTLGNIFRQTLQEILTSPLYGDFVHQCTTDKSKLLSCANCNEGNQSLDFKVICLRKTAAP